MADLPPFFRRETVAVAGGVALAERLPYSNLYRTMSIQVLGFDVDYVVRVEGSLDGTNFSPLVPENFFMPASLKCSADGFIIKLNLDSTYLGGIRLAGSGSTTLGGTIVYTMTDCPYNTSRL